MDALRPPFVGGGYASRERVLSGLTLERATRTPSDASHSIPDELCHLTRWQRVVAFRDEVPYERWERGERYPDRPSASEGEWRALVEGFFEGLHGVSEGAASADALATETDPGITMRDTLAILAVHNAYRLGESVALRQALALGPPA